MEILLNKSDIENMLKEHYGNAIIKIDIPAKLKIKIEVDTNKFIQFKVKTGIVVKPNAEATVPQEPPKTLEEINEIEMSKGLMASGGGNRTLMKF